jgi:integrase
VSVLAYAGLRPGEALALTWGDVQGQTIIGDKAVSAGEQKETKTRQTRAVRLLTPLASDLAEWMRCGRPSNEALVFPRRDGRAWTDSDWNNWRKRVFAPAAKALGGAKLRP